jgi:hypothetical protein
MATRSDTPVLDTLAAMTVDSIERCGLDERTLILTRLAALAGMDAPAISYLAHVDPAIKADRTAEQLQDVLVAIAPVAPRPRQWPRRKPRGGAHPERAVSTCLDLSRPGTQPHCSGTPVLLSQVLFQPQHSLIDHRPSAIDQSTHSRVGRCRLGAARAGAGGLGCWVREYRP